MAEQAKIQTLRDNDTNEQIYPRTLLKAITGTGSKGQVVGFTEDNVLGVLSEIDSNNSVLITLNVLSANWAKGTQTVINENILFDNKYTYILCLAAESYPDYNGGAIWADDISQNGQITLHTKSDISIDLVLNLLRLEVQE